MTPITGRTTRGGPAEKRSQFEAPVCDTGRPLANVSIIYGQEARSPKCPVTRVGHSLVRKHFHRKVRDGHDGWSAAPPSAGVSPAPLCAPPTLQPKAAVVLADVTGQGRFGLPSRRALSIGSDHALASLGGPDVVTQRDAAIHRWRRRRPPWKQMTTGGDRHHRLLPQSGVGLPPPAPPPPRPAWSACAPIMVKMPCLEPCRYHAPRGPRLSLHHPPTITLSRKEKNKKKNLP